MAVHLGPLSPGFAFSQQNSFHDFPMDVREPALDAIVVEGQFGVIKSEQVQDRRVKIMNGHRIFTREISDFIRRAEADSLSHSCAGQETGESVRVMIATG